MRCYAGENSISPFYSMDPTPLIPSISYHPTNNIPFIPYYYLLLYHTIISYYTILYHIILYYTILYHTIPATFPGSRPTWKSPRRCSLGAFEFVEQAQSTRQPWSDPYGRFPWPWGKPMVNIWFIEWFLIWFMMVVEWLLNGY